jgi:hypothetical protein
MMVKDSYNSALQFTSYSERSRIVHLLLLRRVALEEKDADGITALFDADSRLVGVVETFCRRWCIQGGPGSQTADAFNSSDIP